MKNFRALTIRIPAKAFRFLTKSTRVAATIVIACKSQSNYDGLV